MKVYTIGHSTRSIDEFISILREFNIELVVDIRRFPSSKKFPWFCKDNLETKLREFGIEYLHYPKLGGYRREGYKTFSRSEEFTNAIEKLIEITRNKHTALMCAEVLWFKCHRKYVADALAKEGISVIHIYDLKRTQEHKLEDVRIKQRMKTKIKCDKVKGRDRSKRLDTHLK